MRNSNIQQRARDIAALHDAHDDAKAALAEAYDEAAAEGYSKAALKAAIKIHRLDSVRRAKYDEAQSDLLLYLQDIEGRREAAE